MGEFIKNKSKTYNEDSKTIPFMEGEENEGLLIEYLIKYLLACGIGFNIIMIIGLKYLLPKNNLHPNYLNILYQLIFYLLNQLLTY